MIKWSSLLREFCPSATFDQRSHVESPRTETSHLVARHVGVSEVKLITQLFINPLAKKMGI